MVSSFIIVSALLLDTTLSSYASMGCYSDQGYVNDWDDHHNNIQSAYFLNGVEESVHSNRYEDRRWRWRYCQQTSPAFISQFSMSQTSYDSTWYMDCGTYNGHSAMIGGRSDHGNRQEDRLWTWYCGALDTTKYWITGCYDTGYLNTWDATFKFYCPNNGVIRKVYSEHANRQEDRRWGFLCCRIMDVPTPSPSKSPTPSPTPAPTPSPSPSPTPSPSPAPTHHPTKPPTTPAPSTPGTITCDDIEVGDYNDEPLSFTVRMPFQGDLTFDASNSEFTVTSLSAVFFPNIALSGAISDNGILTLSDLEIVGDYIFSISAEPGIVGEFDVRIYCVSDSPSAAPTFAPIDAPTSDPTPAPTLIPSAAPTLTPTTDPTMEPSIEPTDDPTMEPTKDPTDDPTVDPTTAPTFSPTAAPTKSPAETLIINKPTEPPTDDERGVVEETTQNGSYDGIKPSKDDEYNNNIDKSNKGEVYSEIITALIVALVVSCICIICFWIFAKKKKENKMGGAHASLELPHEVADVYGEGHTNITAATNTPGETQLVAMVTDDGCNTEGVGANDTLFDTDEEDEEIDDMYLRQKTEKTQETDIGHAMNMLSGENEEKELLNESGDGIGHAPGIKDEFSSSSSDSNEANDLYRKSTTTKRSSQ